MKPWKGWKMMHSSRWDVFTRIASGIRVQGSGAHGRTMEPWRGRKMWDSSCQDMSPGRSQASGVRVWDSALIWRAP